MTTILKRTILILSVFVLMEVTMLYSLVSTHYGISVANADDASKMVVSDLAYKPPIRNFYVAQKEIIENYHAVREGVAAKVKKDFASVDAKPEKDATKQDVIETEVDNVEVETDSTEPETAEFENAYSDANSIEDEANNSEPGLDGLVPYDGSGRYNANLNGAWYSGSDFQFSGGSGYDDDSGFSFTWYSENVLNGSGLDIPGRHVGDEGYVCDGDGNLCIASDDLPPGTVVDVPFGTGVGVVYDSGSGYGNLDMYVSW